MFGLVILLASASDAFVPSPRLRATPALSSSSPSRDLHARRKKEQQEEEVNFLLKDFVMYNGEIIDPYVVLKVPRQAEPADIKQAYRRLSRLYHPDARRHKEILPGSCNDEMEVREHWERINWSYRLLSNPVRRRKYDRHEMLSDPGRALGRAAARAAWSGVVSAGKGLWNVGSKAVTTIVQEAEKASAATTTTTDMPPKEETATVVEYKSRSGWQARKTGAFRQEADDEFNKDSKTAT